MKRTSSFFLSVIFLLGSSLINAQTYQPDNALPKDPEVITGQLKNGLKYYIRKNHKPEKRVEFRLVLKAGSILENDNQQGLAHFIEHMAFNGSKHFSKNDLVNFLEKSGVTFGADLNAYTSFDETVYMFEIPSDRQGLLDSAFLVIEDWAHNLSLENEEIDKERGVIHEEWRLGLGADDRMRKIYLPVLLKGSRYAERVPIGKMSIVDSCSYDVLKDFYKDWYRPDLMAVVIVGDIDPEFAEKQIKKHFKKIRNPKDERERKEYDIPDNEKPLVAIATDKEATSNMVALLYKHDKKPMVVNKDYRHSILLNLYSMMLNGRLLEISQKPEAPFMFASSSYGSFLAKSKDAWQSFAVAKENKYNQTLSTLIKENLRVKEFGFTENELKRQKSEILSRFKKFLEEKDKTNSKKYVDEYVSNFLTNEPFPGIDYEYNLVKSFLPDITIEDVNALSKELVSNNNMIVLITGPDKEGNKVPSEKDVLRTIAFAKKSKLKPYEEKLVGTSLIETALPGGEITGKTIHKKGEFTALELNNGIKVILKPTDFKNDEILLTAFNEGGTSVVPDDQFFNATMATAIVSQSGVGSFNMIDLNKFLTGKVVKVNPGIGVLTQAINGSSGKKDLETMFQLIYLYFTQPRKDTEAFKAFQSKLLNQVKFLKSNPQYVFYDTLIKLATSNDPRSIIIPTEDQINGLDLDQAMAFYKDRYADAEGFRFFFVGNFDIDSITPLVTKYLGSLPAINRKDEWKNVEPKFPEGITNAVVHKGTEPKSSVAIMLNDDFEWNYPNRLKMSLLLKILEIRLRESMREDQGGVYGVGVNHDLSKYPKPEYSITINWGCGPENVDTLVETVFNEMKSLEDNPPKEEDLQKAKETTIRDMETNVKKNNYWLSVLKNSYYYNEEIKSLDEKKAQIKSISREDIHQAAKQYFKNNHYLKVVLMPEEGEAK